jgi:DNA-binding NarL/FixJ family response regulator
MTAPLQVIALTFRPGADSEGAILAEVDRLQGRGVLRVLDLLFLAKGQDGTIERLEIGDEEDFGSLLAGVIPVGDGDQAGSGQAGADPAGPEPASRAAFAGDFGPADALALAQSLEPGTALAFLLVEHHWAAPLFDAISAAGGTLIGEGFLTSGTETAVGAEVAALEEASRVIAEAQAAEAAAVLRALAASAEAAQAVEASERIQSAAAADAVRALIAAGLVEEAAAHEAVTALTAAGLITDAAGDATADSLAVDLATISAADEVAAEASAEAAARVRAAAITRSEAQVLRYLPKDLPFSVIADKLGISRSAAKERAERLYKRLGVHNRADAVSRARQVGLLRA